MLNWLPDRAWDFLPDWLLDWQIAVNHRRIWRGIEDAMRIKRGLPVPDTQYNRNLRKLIEEVSRRVASGEDETTVLLTLPPPQRRWRRVVAS